MYPKFKTNLIGLTVALGAVAAGFGLGEPPSLPVHVVEPAIAAVADADPLALRDAADARARAGRGAVRRHMAMPYVSLAALMPRQES